MTLEFPIWVVHGPLEPVSTKDESIHPVADRRAFWERGHALVKHPIKPLKGMSKTKRKMAKKSRRRNRK
jgi:hypothetical protein